MFFHEKKHHDRNVFHEQVDVFPYKITYTFSKLFEYYNNTTAFSTFCLNMTVHKSKSKVRIDFYINHMWLVLIRTLLYRYIPKYMSVNKNYKWLQEYGIKSCVVVGFNFQGGRVFLKRKKKKKAFKVEELATQGPPLRTS